ncbi:MAG: xanthine dehydrogenase family protein molybdopterin-binding subunit [Chloroflexi bacterium]|nr:xanthine dehydrogenase family protein molybdopterin-binding subunit [Chloroflexota bacterium]
MSNEPAIKIVDHPLWSDDPESPVAEYPEATLLQISADGQITGYSGKVEYGQGIRHGFALAIADELDTPIDSVTVVLADTALVPYDRATVGSASTRTVGLQLRRSAATLRRYLLSLAADYFKSDVRTLSCKAGKVVRAGEAKDEVTFAALLPASQVTLDIPDDIRPKPESEFNAMGTDHPRSDAIARVTGKAMYSQDVFVDEMLHAVVIRPPSYGATLLNVEATRAEQTPGFVRFIREGDFAAIICDSADGAETAAKMVRARWDELDAEVSDFSMPVALKQHANELVSLRSEGNVDAAFDSAASVIEGVYYAPYVANAAMEPSAAVAQWDGDNLTVWCSSRSPFGEREAIAAALDVTETNVRVICTEVGGSFGTRSATISIDAARLARAAGRPVKVAHTRDEEFVWSTVRPAALIEVRSAVDSSGAITAWDYAAYHSGESPFRGRRGADTPYDVPNVSVQVANSVSPLQSGSYRSLGGAVNHFAREVHMDRIASQLGIDPIEFRLNNLSHARLRKTLTNAADVFGWSASKTGSNGIGVAIGYDAGSFLTQAAEVSTAGRDVNVDRVHTSFDCGLVLNPDGVRNQVEGSIVMGMGTALWESVEFDGGRILNPSFSRYRVPRITETPALDVSLIGDPNTPSTGAGEPAIVTVAAAIANAVTSATGRQIDTLPITPQL